MPIKFDRKRKVLHLYNNEISYLFHISPDNKLIHLYFGSYLSDFDLNKDIILSPFMPTKPVPQEYQTPRWANSLPFGMHSKGR